MIEPILRAQGLVKSFHAGGSTRRTPQEVRAVDGVSLDIAAGEIFGLVGESGSGKSTLGRLLLRLLEPTEGSIYYDGRDISHLKRRELRSVYRDIRMVFQDPYSSLDPRQTIGESVAEPLRLHKVGGGKQLDKQVANLFDKTGLDPSWRGRYSHELSGGQRQRVGIARALALSPRVLIADEPVSALDVSVQASILNMLLDLQSEMGFACIFISHDLSVVDFVSQRIGVMYLGELVEIGPTSEIVDRPRHPYTISLLSGALSSVGAPRDRQRIVLEGDVPSPMSPPPGCRFHTRCPVAIETCSQVAPDLRARANDDHPVACHLVDEHGTPPEIRSSRGFPS